MELKALKIFSCIVTKIRFYFLVILYGFKCSFTYYLWTKMLEAPCLKVPKSSGEGGISLVRELDLFNNQLKVQQLNNHICIPLTNKPSSVAYRKIQNTLQDFEILIHNFPEMETHRLTHLDLLADKLHPSLLSSVPRAIDFIGNIAIVEIPPKLVEHKKTIGEALLKANKRTRTVLAKSGAIEGTYRLRSFEVIAGVKNTVTIYTEYGCVFHVDVAKTYFSPRLSTEHNRIASNVKTGETVIDLFAGVGPFAIPIAKKIKNVQVYAIDVNPNAIAFLKRNITTNRTEKQVIPFLGDARKIVKEKLSGKADRIIMNLPETAIEYVDVACEALKTKGGIIHYYSFVNASDQLETATVRLTEEVNKNHRQIKKIQLAKTVREVAPYTWQVVVDAQIQ
jgi:tRNA (guanine37-N1)-methyltransferase